MNLKGEVKFIPAADTPVVNSYAAKQTLPTVVEL